MSYLIGRGRTARETYPETARGGGATGAFARNFATGPASGTTIVADGVQVPWDPIDIGTSGTDVPITPKSTGVILVSGVIVISNTSEDPMSVLVSVQLNGTTLPGSPTDLGAEIDAGSTVAIPILAASHPLDTPVGTTSLIQIFVNSEEANAGIIDAKSSSLNLQEVPVSTG